MNRTSILVATLMITMAACGGQPEPELPAPVVDSTAIREQARRDSIEAARVAREAGAWVVSRPVHRGGGAALRMGFNLREGVRNITLTLTYGYSDIRNQLPEIVQAQAELTAAAVLGLVGSVGGGVNSCQRRHDR